LILQRSSGEKLLNMPQYRLSALAQRDLDAIFDYTVETWDLAQALHYTDTIENACALLAKIPTKGSDCTHIRRGYRRYRVEQHVIYFRATTYGVSIIRILHGKMDASRHV
jgi:toxin ParE1/3/4